MYHGLFEKSFEEWYGTLLNSQGFGDVVRLPIRGFFFTFFKKKKSDLLKFNVLLLREFSGDRRFCSTIPSFGQHCGNATQSTKVLVMNDKDTHEKDIQLFIRVGRLCDVPLSLSFIVCTPWQKRWSVNEDIQRLYGKYFATLPSGVIRQPLLQF